MAIEHENVEDPQQGDYITKRNEKNTTGYKSMNTGRIFKHAKLADESQHKISEQDLKQLFIDGIGGQVIQINSKVNDKSP